MSSNEPTNTNEQGKPANPASSNNADAQIYAHRQQHQAKLKKIALIVSVVVVISIVLIVLLKLMSARTNAPVEVSEAVPAVTLSQAQLSQYREQFKQALTQYELDIQPQINDILLTDWETSKARDLSFLKEQALTAFAQGAFSQAKQQLETLNKNSQALIDQWQNETQTHLDNAQQAFADDQIPQAQLNLNKALALMPSNQSALALQNRIDAYGEISELLSELKVAKVENNLPKQIDLLSGIIKLDPQLDEYNDDLNNAKVSFDKQQLAKLLQQAEQALALDNIDSAEILLTQVRKINPNSKGVQALSTRISKLKSSQSLVAVKENLAQLKKQDNWPQIQQVAAASLAKYANDSVLKTYLEQSVQVMNAQKSLAIFMQKPERLADQNIREAASERMQNALTASLLSPSLQQQMALLGENIDKYTGPVSVSIESDGNTYIVVVGVGHVGSNMQKTIQLTPGQYVLEGKRQGYRNKRMEIAVSANQPISVTLICDQAL